MNITPVNNITHTNKNANKNHRTNINHAIRNSISFDNVAFLGKEKTNLLDKLKSLFNKGATEDVEDIEETELTEEERKDAIIRGTFKGIQEADKEYSRVAKIEVKTLNTLIKLGKLQDFKPYLPYEDGKKLLFGGFDEKGLPTRLDIVNLKDGMSIDKSYDFNCGRGLFSTTIRYSRRSNTKLEILNGKPLYMFDKNYEDGSFQRMSFLDNAVHFISGPLNSHDDTSRVAQIAYFNYKDPDKCYYIDLDDVENCYNFYKYDIDKNFWVVEKNMTPKEVEDFMQSQEF